MSESKKYNFRSSDKISSQLDQYKTPSMQLMYIERTLQKIQDGEIKVEDSTREMLQDRAIVIWEEAPATVKKSSQVRMEYILQSAKEFEANRGESEKFKYYGEILDTIADKEKDHRENNKHLGAKVAVYAGIASAAIFLSASSITGNVILEDSASIISQSSIAIILGILVAFVTILVSRKR